MVAPSDSLVQTFENFGSLNELPSKECYDTTDRVLFKYNWTINSRILQSTELEKFVSPEFPNKANSGLTWFLTLKPPNSNSAFKNKAFSLKLTLASCNITGVTVTYNVSLQNFNDQKIPILENTRTLFNVNGSTDVFGYTEFFPTFIVHSKISDFIIKCQITVPAVQFYSNKSLSIPNSLSKPYQRGNSFRETRRRRRTNSIFQFKEELKAMFEIGEFTDVVFSVSGKELYAHKVILAAGSSVFKAMFEHDMMEKNQNRVEITDIEFEVLQEMVGFIYTDNAPNLDSMAKELFVAADKYDLNELRNKCERVLCRNISTQNVAEVFIFADTYYAVFLKAEAKKYIVGHSIDVSSTSGWQGMIVTHPHLLAQAFIALSYK